MAYTIPPGNKVALPLTSETPYAPPHGNKVAFRFGGLPGTVFAAGFDMSLFGDASVRNATAQVFTTGWNSGLVSTNLVVTKSLMVVGISAGPFGTPSLFNLTKIMFPTGFAAGAMGTQWVSLGTRRLTGVTLADQSGFGTLELAGGVRVVDLAGRGIVAPSVPGPVLTFRVREIFPNFIVATQWGRPLVDFQHDVSVPGIDDGAWGQPEVYRPRFVVDLQDQGIHGPVWGDNAVRLAKQYVAPVGWIGGGATGPEQFGRTLVYNLTQIVVQQFEVTPSDGGVVGDFNLVMNRNQVPRPEGFVMARYGTPEIRNAARIVTTPAFIEFTAWGDNLVAPAIRTIQPVGADTSGWGSPLGMIVYNGARVINPSGIDAGGLGRPNPVWSNLQGLRLVGADTSSFGLGMVAFAVRNVTPWSLPDPPPFGDVHVEHWVRELRPEGVAAGGVGAATLEQHFTIIAPKSVLPPANAFGEGRVRNVTPEIPIFGWTATLFGRTDVFNQFEHYAFQGFGGETFGHQVVKDRRITVIAEGVQPLPISQRHQVRNVMPDPPAPQTVLPVGIGDPQPGRPVFRTNVLYPTWGSADARFGTPQLVSNGMMPQGIPPPYSPDTGVQCGVPSFNGPQYCAPTGIKPVDATSTVPDVGPRYVWAPMGYPYTTGLWRDIGQQMDQSVFGTDHPERPVFGRAELTLRNRGINVGSSSSLAMGTAAVVQRPLYVRMTGTKLQRFGFPTLNGGGGVGVYGLSMTEWGDTAVQHAEDLGPRTIKPAGFAAGVLPAQDVQLFNRRLLIQGIDSFKISPPTPPAWPRTSTWISNAYAPFPFVGRDHAVYGTAWVSNYVRYLSPEGWQSDVVAMDSPGAFRDRMRVRKQLRVDGVSAVTGSAVGEPWLSQWTSQLRTAPISPPALGRPGVSARSRINADGWASMTFGDLQRWEAGKVKAHGDELAQYGRAVIRRSVRPAGFAGEVGAARLGAPLHPVGAAHGGAGSATLTAMWCGDRAVAIDEGPAGVVGTPMLEVSV